MIFNLIVHLFALELVAFAKDEISIVFHVAKKTIMHHCCFMLVVKNQKLEYYVRKSEY